MHLTRAFIWLVLVQVVVIIVSLRTFGVIVPVSFAPLREARIITTGASAHTVLRQHGAGGDSLLSHGALARMGTREPGQDVLLDNLVRTAGNAPPVGSDGEILSIGRAAPVAVAAQFQLQDLLDPDVIGINLSALQLHKFKSKMEAVHARWKPLQKGNPRSTGLGPDEKDEADGGLAVLGSWPEGLSELTYLHLHKCAGTTLMNAIGDLRQRLGATVNMVYSGSGRAGVANLDSHMRKTALDQRMANNEGEGHAVFTVLRDPVARFLSSTGEVMRLSNSSKFRRACLKGTGTATDMLECVLNELERWGTWTDIHFYPQTVEIIKSTSAQEGVTVSFFSYDDIKQILLELGCDVDRNERQRNDAEYFLSRWEDMDKKRNAKSTTGAEQRRKDATMLSEMSIDDLTRELKDDICRIYAVDVKLMRHYGVRVPHCL